MTDGERKALTRGFAAGASTGLAIGLIVALFVAIRPQVFATLIG